MLYTRQPTGIQIKSASELDVMRRAGRLASQCLQHLIAHAKPGVSTQDLDDLSMEFARKHNARPATLGYRGYTKSICTSINEVICHGIPTASRILKDGDIIGIDVTLIVDGFHGDTCATVPVGEVSPLAARLLNVTLEATRKGIEAVKGDGRLDEIGRAIETYAKPFGFSVVEDFVGHGIGRSFHEPPQVAHFAQRTMAGGRTRLRSGMTFTVEPMINEGIAGSRVLSDGWTAVTADGKLSAQFEHTIAVTRWGYEILTVQNDTGVWEPPGRAMMPPISETTP